MAKEAMKMIYTSTFHDKHCKCGQLKPGEWYAVYKVEPQIAYPSELLFEYNGDPISRGKVPKCLLRLYEGDDNEATQTDT